MSRKLSKGDFLKIASAALTLSLDDWETLCSARLEQDTAKKAKGAKKMRKVTTAQQGAA